MGVNAPLLYQVLGFLETNPDQWDQGNWTNMTDLNGDPLTSPFDCGAKGCFAGWAAVFGGARMSPGGAAVAVTPEGTRIGSIETHAAELLGLTQEQSNRLFSGNNTIDEIKDAIRDFTKPKYKAPPKYEVTGTITAKGLSASEADSVEASLITAAGTMRLTAEIQRKEVAGIPSTMPDTREEKKALWLQLKAEGNERVIGSCCNDPDICIYELNQLQAIIDENS